MITKKQLAYQVPIYASRPAGDGEVGTVYIAAGIFMLLYTLALANLLLWGLVGIIEAFKVLWF